MPDHDCSCCRALETIERKALQLKQELFPRSMGTVLRGRAMPPSGQKAKRLLNEILSISQETRADDE
jgi:hypothetical protein